MGLGIFDEHSAVNPAADLTDADTTVPAYLTQGAARGTRIDDVILTSSSATAHDVAIVLDNGTPRVLGCVSVPAGAGLTSAVAHVSAASLFPVPTASLILAGGTTLKVGMVVTLGGGEAVHALAFGGDF